MMGVRRARMKPQAERDVLADQFEDTLEEINAEVRAVKTKFARVRMNGRALIAERGEHEWLN